MRLGRGAEDAEASEIEIEEVGRRVDAAQGTVEVEVVAFEPLLEAARQYHLEYVAPQAVGNGTADVGAVFVVGQCGGHFSRWVETIRRKVAVHYGGLYLVQAAGLTFGQHLDEHQFVSEVVEYDEVAVEDVECVGGIIPFLPAVLHGNAFEVADGVERRIAVEAAVAASFACDVEAGQKMVQGCRHPSFGFQTVLLPRTVGQAGHYCSMTDADGSDGTQADERAAVFTPVVVRAFHEGALWEKVTQFQVRAHWSVDVARQGAQLGSIMVSHKLNSV